MSEKIVAAALQMNSGEDKQANLNRATELIEEAARRGARRAARPQPSVDKKKWASAGQC